jgi:SET domain-containing protein
MAMNDEETSWISPKAGIRNSSLGGQGLFATEKINLGETVVVWKGHYCGAREAQEAKGVGKLIMQWDEDLYSIEERGSDDGYFINHSCDPNLWMKDAFTLTARRDIQAGEEITADYILWEADEDYIAKWVCHCGSPQCRKKVTGQDWRNPTLQAVYRNHFSPLLNKRIKNLFLHRH